MEKDSWAVSWQLIRSHHSSSDGEFLCCCSWTGQTETGFYTRLMCQFTGSVWCLGCIWYLLVWYTLINTLHLNTHHIFLSTRRRVVLTDLQLQHIPLPVEGKTAKEFHHGALVSERGVKDWKQMQTASAEGQDSTSVTRTIGKLINWENWSVSGWAMFHKNKDLLLGHQEQDSKDGNWCHLIGC